MLVLPLLLVVGAHARTPCPRTYWTGKCTACPGYWYQTCNPGYSDKDQRGCGFLGCETACYDADANGYDEGCGCGKGQGCLNKDCSVGQWKAWSSCSKTCGGGKQTRKRDITQQQKGNGKACPSLEEEQDCNTQECPRDCKVGDWGNWSTCTKECNGGEQTRTRSVTQTKIGNGEPCPPLEQTQDCNIQACQTEPYCVEIVTGNADSNDGFLSVSVNGGKSIEDDWEKNDTVIKWCYDDFKSMTIKNTKTDGWYGDITVTTESGKPVALLCEGCTGKRFSKGIAVDGDSNGAQMGDTHCLNGKDCVFTPFYGPNCVSIITGAGDYDNGGLTVMVGAKVVVPQADFDHKEVVLQRCFEGLKPNDLKLTNKDDNAWVGTLTLTHFGVPTPLDCDKCTGRTFGFGDDKIVVDGDDNYPEEVKTQCLGGETCSFAAVYDGYCLSIVTGDTSNADGYLSVTVYDDEAVALKNHEKKSAVIQECFKGDAPFMFKLQNTNTNAWNGKAEVTQHGKSVDLTCEGCTGAKFTNTIAVDGNDDAKGASGMSKTLCLNKKVCTFSSPTPAPTPAPETRAPTVETTAQAPTVAPECDGIKYGHNDKAIKIKNGTKMTMVLTNKDQCECHDKCKSKNYTYFMMYLKKDKPKCDCLKDGKLKKITDRTHAVSGGTTDEARDAVKSKVEGGGGRRGRRRRRDRGGRRRRRN